MKKLLGISLVAVLAATPLMAEAARGVSVANYSAGENTNDIASTSYVKGAYEAASDRIDALVTDTDVTGVHNVIVAGDSVASNLGALDTAIGDTTSFDGANVSAAISALQTSIGDGAEALGGRVSALETTVGDNTSGLVKGLADEISRAEGVEGDLDDLTTTAQNNLVAAINEVDDHADANTTAISDEVTRATAAEEALGGRIDTLTGNANTTYAKKVGVTQTITNSTIAGTVPVVKDWTNGTTGTVAITASITGAEYAEPTAQETPGSSL